METGKQITRCRLAGHDRGQRDSKATMRSKNPRGGALSPKKMVPDSVRINRRGKGRGEDFKTTTLEGDFFNL